MWHHWEAKRMDKVMPSKIFFTVSDKRMPSFPKPAGVLDEDELKASLEQINEFISHHIGKPRYEENFTPFMNSNFFEANISYFLNISYLFTY